MSRDAIYQDIEAERLRQDARWGGPAHDAEHTANDWVALIVRQAGDASRAEEGGTVLGFQYRMLKVAALAVAAIEASRQWR